MPELNRHCLELRTPNYRYGWHNGGCNAAWSRCFLAFPHELLDPCHGVVLAFTNHRTLHCIYWCQYFAYCSKTLIIMKDCLFSFFHSSLAVFSKAFKMKKMYRRAISVFAEVLSARECNGHWGRRRWAQSMVDYWRLGDVGADWRLDP